MPAAIAHYWAQADAISHFVAILLVLMSLLSWATILFKAWSFWRIRQAAKQLQKFWQYPSFADAIDMLRLRDQENVFLPLAERSLALTQGGSSVLQSHSSRIEKINHVLRHALNDVTVKLESGLSVLASIGATAPFVGLLGTVWGIYHAMSTVATGGGVQIDQIIGPVGEALIMTALGLVVAIPAVLAYNALNRVNRITFAELDTFAYDLRVFFSHDEHELR